jgi:hypothetical protein
MGSVNAHRQNFGRSLEYHNLQPLKSTCHSARKSTQTCPNDDDPESLCHCMSASTELERTQELWSQYIRQIGNVD